MNLLKFIFVFFSLTTARTITTTKNDRKTLARKHRDLISYNRMVNNLYNRRKYRKDLENELMLANIKRFFKEAKHNLDKEPPS
jgi:hypothetical protein